MDNPSKYVHDNQIKMLDIVIHFFVNMNNMTSCCLKPTSGKQIISAAGVLLHVPYYIVQSGHTSYVLRVVHCYQNIYENYQPVIKCIDNPHRRTSSTVYILQDLTLSLLKSEVLKVLEIAQIQGKRNCRKMARNSIWRPS